jgi:hypothetical protein
VHDLGSYVRPNSPYHACTQWSEAEYVHGQIQPLGVNIRDDVHCLILISFRPYVTPTRSPDTALQLANTLDVQCKGLLLSGNVIRSSSESIARLFRPTTDQELSFKRIQLETPAGLLSSHFVHQIRPRKPTPKVLFSTPIFFERQGNLVFGVFLFGTSSISLDHAY